MPRAPKVYNQVQQLDASIRVRDKDGVEREEPLFRDEETGLELLKYAECQNYIRAPGRSPKCYLTHLAGSQCAAWKIQRERRETEEEPLRVGREIGLIPIPPNLVVSDNGILI
jgi:hypothetical protein